ncbi:MAG: hypothetical protein M3T96_09150 [Acidobacteriota bacterium]|nr:hypothetical protein [Acidobacteriota bacterium]
MKKHLFSAFIPLIVFAAVVSAQNTAERSVENARQEFREIKNRSIEMERVTREANKRPTESSAPKFPEIKEDFEQIQKISGQILKLAAAETPVDYVAVLKSVSELNRRAVRLKSNMFAADPEQDKAAKAELSDAVKAAAVKPLSEMLDEAVNRFAHSSIFQNASLVNSKDSQNAQRDLEAAIKISSSIKERAKKLARRDSER